MKALTSFKAYCILTRTALLRRLNRVLAANWRKPKKVGVREATAPKKRFGSGLFFFFSLFFLWNSGFVADQFLSALSRELDHRPAAVRPSAAPGERPVQTSGAESARPASNATFRSALRGPEEKRDAATAIVGLVLLAVSLSNILYNLGSKNQDLGQVEWSLQWLFTFPVPLNALHLSKLTEYTLGNFFGWFLYLPILFLVFLAGGWGFLSVPFAIGTTLYFLWFIGAVQLFLEIWMRKHLARGKLKNIQALFTVGGTLSFFAVVALAFAKGGTALLLDHGLTAARALALSPLNAPARLALGGRESVLILLEMAVFVTGVSGLVLFGAGRLLREGLLTESGAYGSRHRRPLRRAPARAGRLRGVAAKDLRLLLRDRNLLVQSVFVPVAIVAFQVIVNPGLFQAIQRDVHHAAALAFGLGAYVLVFSSVHVLTVEGKASWLLFTFPKPLERILLGKAIVWGIVASIMPVIFLTWSFIHLKTLGFVNLVNAALVIAGLIVYAFLGAGIGALGTNLLETDVRRKIRPGVIYLFMLLSGIYTYALYADSLWDKMTFFAFCLLLAYAVWQQVRDHAPYILDPSMSPPPRLCLSDGMVALMVFFVLQGILQTLFNKKEVLPPGTGRLVAFSVAGLVAILLSLMILLRRGATASMDSTDDFAADEHAPGRASARTSFLEGAAFGFFAFCAGAAYLWGIEHVESLRRIKEAMSLKPVDLKWYAPLAIIAAPLIEEYLFRGLVYRGLRRSMSLIPALVINAALFASVHPGISAGPVFVMGLLAALSLERNRLLLAPVVVHAVYNAGVLWITF